MKLKVRLLDKVLRRSYFGFLTTISLFCSFLVIAFELPDDNSIRVIAGFSIIGFFIGVYLVMWVAANLQNKATLVINNSIIEIKLGDIFRAVGLKVIAFNEYFDTKVDNIIIAENTLNGIFIKLRPDKVNEIDSTIENDVHLQSKIVEVNEGRREGKRNKYELGTVCQYENFLLTAFSQFDNENRAHLFLRDYVDFLMNFWNEIDIIYAGKSVSIPLLGSGITRFKDYSSISEQELLELIIWSFRLSRIKFTYPSRVSIVIHESKKDKINFYKLKEF